MISPKLLSIPLFQGISQSDMTEIMGYTRFDFEKFEKGRTIIKQGESCERLVFLLNGTVEAVTTSSDNAIIVHEYINAPLQFQPERLFGLNQHYTSTFRAHTLCHTMKLSKAEVTKIYNNYEVFRINLLNILSTRLQRVEDRQRLSNKMTLRLRILRFFTTHCLYPAGEKIFKLKMTDLASELNDSRLNISIELNRLQDEGLIKLSRTKIHIPALEHLFM